MSEEVLEQLRADVVRGQTAYQRSVSAITTVVTLAIVAGVTPILDGRSLLKAAVFAVLGALAGWFIGRTAIRRLKAHRQAYREAILALARAGDVRAIPLLMNQRGVGFGWGPYTAEIAPLLADLLQRVRPEDAPLLCRRNATPIQRLLPSAAGQDDAPAELVMAALTALAHVGDRSDLPALAGIAGNDEGWVDDIRRAAEEAIAAIEERMATEAAGATLLRPAEPGAEVLLRPAEDGEANLLRAADGEVGPNS